jgi:hypothetical protein
MFLGSTYIQICSFFIVLSDMFELIALMFLDYFLYLHHPFKFAIRQFLFFLHHMNEMLLYLKDTYPVDPTDNERTLQNIHAHQMTMTSTNCADFHISIKLLAHDSVIDVITKMMV